MVQNKSLLPPTGLLFPTPYWYFNEPLPEGVYEWCLDVKKNNPDSESKSNRGGYHSPVCSNFFPPDFPYTKHLQNTLQGLPLFKFDNWWINIQEKGDYNISHTHPGVDLSGIWYITDNNGTTIFENPQQHTRHFLYEKYDDKDIFGQTSIITANAGDIMIFPSDLLHHVKSHKLESTRISVSFNINILY